jgi:histidyl-tRNA synthetase
MAKANTEPLSGMRDYLPLDVLRRKHVTNTIERVYQSYGFEPLETPVMERLSTLLGKYGDEGDQLIFRVMKRGDKLQKALATTPTENEVADAGLRYDLTVPLARVYAEYREKLPRYFKRYQIQQVYRADRPARGRYREFWQCDVDVVGSNNPSVEAEVIAAGVEILLDLGFVSLGDFNIRLNHRSILRGLIEAAGIPADREGDALVSVDKLDKIGMDGVRADLLARGIAVEAVDKLLATMTSAPDENADVVGWLATTLAAIPSALAGIHNLANVLALSESTPAANYIRVDPWLARGLSYYTGCIYEIEFPGFSGSGGGGGRYDDLVGMFSGQKVSACGFSLGLERIILLMEEKDLFPTALAGEPQVLVTQYDETTQTDSIACANELRRAGLRVDLYPDGDRYGKQFKYAEERRIQYAILLSPREIESSVAAVKDLVSGEQIDVERPQLTEYLRARFAA